MLPHVFGAVGDEPRVLHPAGQSEAEVHPDVVVQGPVIRRCIGTERAIPICDLPLDDPASVNQTAVLLHLSCGGQADNVVESDIPIPSIVRVRGIDDPALDTVENENNIPAVNGPGLGALLRDPHHSFFLQDNVSSFDHLLVFAGPQVLEELASGDEVSLGRIAPGHVLNNAKVRRVVIGVGRPFQIRDVEVPVFRQDSQLQVVLNGLGLAFQTLGQCLKAFIFTQGKGVGFLSCTFDLPGQRGAVIIIQDDQLWGWVPFATFCLRLLCLVGERFVV